VDSEDARVGRSIDANGPVFTEVIPIAKRAFPASLGTNSERAISNALAFTAGDEIFSANRRPNNCNMFTDISLPHQTHVSDRREPWRGCFP